MSSAPDSQPTPDEDLAVRWAATPILVVDDEPRIRDLFALMLERRGRTVITAASAAEALEIVRTRALILVISDQHMPFVTGLELLETVRREKPGLPFVLTSAVMDDEVSSRARLAGADAVVDKSELLTELSTGPESGDYLDAA